MSRYRPPLHSATPLITEQGHARLCKELEHLWQIERPCVVRAVSEAAALGDRSENAEYIYGKKRLREIDRRVRFLRKRLEQLQIVKQTPADTQKVYFGAWIELEDEIGKVLSFRIVGPDELDLRQGFISIDSPLSRALLGKRLDEQVRVQTPEGEKVFYLIGIEYR